MSLQRNLIIFWRARASACYACPSGTTGGGHITGALRLNGLTVFICRLSFISAAPWTHFSLSAEVSLAPLSFLPSSAQGSHPNMARRLWLLLSNLLFVLSFGAEGAYSRERVYFIGIIEDDWSYAPSEKNLLNGLNIEDDE